MAYTYEELKSKKVVELREIASGLDHPAVKGYTQLNKQHLLEAVCKALNIDMHVHHEVVGLNKKQIKAQIRKLKVKRDEALAAKDAAQLKFVRHHISHLRKKLRAAMV